MKNFMQKDLSDGFGIVKSSSRRNARLIRDLSAIIYKLLNRLRLLAALKWQWF